MPEALERTVDIVLASEREHGLTNAAERGGRGSGRIRGDREQTERGAGQPDRDWLRATIGRVLGEGGGIDELRAAGVAVKLNEASTGRVSGISYVRAPEPGRDGGEADPIWFKAANWARPTAGTRSAAGCATPPLGAASRPRPDPRKHRRRPQLTNVVMSAGSCLNRWHGRGN